MYMMFNKLGTLKGLWLVSWQGQNVHVKLAFKYKFYCYLTELRQSAEGVDVLPDILGDGGGGGDGSSGNNSDADDGGPAGGNR